MTALSTRSSTPAELRIAHVVAHIRGNFSHLVDPQPDPHTERVGGETQDGDLLDEWLQGGGILYLDRLTGASSDVLGIIDLDHVIRYVNWTAPGLSRQDTVGVSAFSMIPPSDTPAAREAFDRVFTTGKPSVFEITYANDVGVIVFVVRVNPIVHDGKVIGAFTINTDVTEERQSTVDRDRFFSLSLDMLIVVTPGGHLRRVNPAFAEALGYSISDVVGKPFLDFVHPEDQERTQHGYEMVLNSQSVPDFENRYRRKDGTFRVFSWRATADPVTGDVYAVARDVTDHRATEVQLRHAQKMEAVGQLAGGIAHDFNNLMQAVLANVELALEAPATPANVVEHLREIDSAGQRAAELTKQLLVFSRRQPLDQVAIDVNASILGLLKLLRRLLPENIVIETRLAHGIAPVSADRTQFEQIVINLCVNARDAMETGGRLTLETCEVVLTESDCEIHPWARPGQFACLSVTDTGVGMSPEVRDRAFDPFFTTKGHRSGTGLGLSTLYGIVQQHGGFVHLYTELDQGTTFKIYLPASEAPWDKSTPPDATQIARGSETILIAEDEDAVRKPVLRILNGAGYRTLAACNGREAIHLLAEHGDAVDLAVLDVVMPELGGPEAWSQMREMRPGLGVIFTSGHADARYRERLPEGVEVLDKPFRTDELLRKIRSMLDE